MTVEKNILCFGDSNTWGCNPVDGSRYDRETRWPGVLQATLGNEYYIVEEGLCGRSTVWDDPIEGDKNGFKQLLPIVKSHEPLDLVIIMLGTNDLKNRFSVSALDVANSVSRLVKGVLSCTYPHSGKAPDVLVVCPPPFASLDGTGFADMFIGGEEKSHQLATAFSAAADRGGFRCFNAGNLIESSPIDGIHFDADQHRKLGTALAEEVAGMLLDVDDRTMSGNEELLTELAF